MSKAYLVDKETVRQIGRELWRLRREKNLLLHQVEKRIGVPAKIVESLELGRYLQYGYLRKLLVFYGKELRIVLEWKANPSGHVFGVVKQHQKRDRWIVKVPSF